MRVIAARAIPFCLIAIFMMSVPAVAQADVGFSFGVSSGGWHRWHRWHPHHYWGWSAWSWPDYGYYVPPPVVYAEPVVPPPVVYVTPPVVYTEPTLPANQTSPTYIDNYGRTCRHFQATSGGGPAFGVACLQPDGSWRVVQ